MMTLAPLEKPQECLTLNQKSDQDFIDKSFGTLMSTLIMIRNIDN